jgi:hypothetical protein
MSIYNNGKIYKLVNSFGTTYVGSTTQTLAQRKGKHVGYYKSALLHPEIKRQAFSVKVFQEDPDNVDIVLLELVNCDSKMELHKRERHWIENIVCVNKVIPLRTSKEYYIDNAVKNLAYVKLYREKNKDKIKAYKSQPHLCECGITVIHHSIARHKRSKPHIKYMEILNNPVENNIILI